MHSSDLFARKLKIKFSMDITPLIDIVFLLVAFFLITSSLGKDQAIRVDLPQAKESKNIEKKDMIISITAEGKVHVDGNALSEEDYTQELRKLVQQKKEAGLSKVILRGDKKSQYEKIIEIMDLLSTEGVHNFGLAVDKK